MIAFSITKKAATVAAWTGYQNCSGAHRRTTPVKLLYLRRGGTVPMPLGTVSTASSAVTRAAQHVSDASNVQVMARTHTRRMASPERIEAHTAQDNIGSHAMLVLIPRTAQQLRGTHAEGSLAECCCRCADTRARTRLARLIRALPQASECAETRASRHGSSASSAPHRRLGRSSPVRCPRRRRCAYL